jgi:hypothetical protein
MGEMIIDNQEKPHTKYVCNNCHYYSSNKKDYGRHILTAKHKKVMNDNLTVIKNLQCNCGKEYRHMSGLSRHKRICNISAKDIVLENTMTSAPLPPHFDATLVIELLKQNQEFKAIMLEQSKQLVEQHSQMAEHQTQLIEAVKDGKLGNTNTNTNCNNTTNNKFNLNVFLNETCKDAISMDDFIKSFEVTRDEFLHTGKVGYIEGISAVMANRFKDMDVHARPLHCTDLKRETIYIKNADKWEKDDADKTHMRKAVRGVARKNKQEMWKWYDENKPEVEQIGTDICEDYFTYHMSTLGGYGKEEDLKYEEKIIKNILKCVHVDKSTSLTLS